MNVGKSTMPKGERRRAFALAYTNGALWSFGNGLASTSLIIYMIRALGAEGLWIGVVLAAPHLVGVLRLVAPALVGRAGSRKNLCVVAFGASAILLAAISQLAEPRQLTSPAMSLNVIVALWCIYHLLEYIGTVYLWAWLGDIAPRRIRGRFIARRERWMLILRIMGMLGGGAFSEVWLDEGIRDYDWMAYAIPGCAGAACMMMAIVPLVRMPEPAIAVEQTLNPLPLAAWWQPLANRNMRWLLAFGAWFSLANGLTQSAQYLFPLMVFGLSLFARQMLEASMRFAQSLGAATVGNIADRFGNRRLIIVAQLIVAFGPLSLFIASCVAPDLPREFHDGSHWWDYPDEFWGGSGFWWTHGGFWVALTWLFFVAYVGINVGLPNLMLKLAAPTERASYIAWYFALTGVFYGLSAIAGGALYGLLEERQPKLDLFFFTLDHNELLFLAGFALRATAVLWLLPIVESPWGRSPDLPVSAREKQFQSGRSRDLPH